MQLDQYFILTKLIATILSLFKVKNNGIKPYQNVRFDGLCTIVLLCVQMIGEHCLQQSHEDESKGSSNKQIRSLGVGQMWKRTVAISEQENN